MQESISAKQQRRPVKKQAFSRSLSCPRIAVSADSQGSIYSGVASSTLTSGPYAIVYAWGPPFVSLKDGLDKSQLILKFRSLRDALCVLDGDFRADVKSGALG